LGLFLWKFVRENARAYKIMMFDFADCADKGLRRPWMFPFTGCDTLVTKLSAYTGYWLYGQLTPIDRGMEILASNCLLLLIRAASSLTDNFQMCILGHVFCGCIGSLLVDKLVPAFLLCANK